MEKKMKKEDLQKSIEILGFNPISKEYKAVDGLYTLTPIRAKRILDYHNTNNRAFSEGQQKTIGKSIDKNNWQNDGDPLRFDTDGMTPEFQHRLKEIVRRNITVKVPLVLGVSKESFTKTAGALPRTAWSEISRIDKTAIRDEASTLNALITRRVYKSKGEELTLQNASKLWPEWKEHVRNGEKLTESFFDGKTNKWDSNRRIFAAWAAMMSFHDKSKFVNIFLDMLKNETLELDTKPLTKDFLKLFTHEDTAYFKNTHRPRFMWFLLCIAADRLMESPDGNIEMKKSLGELNHNDLKQKGTYRLFLYDPDDNLKQKGFKVAAE